MMKRFSAQMAIALASCCAASPQGRPIDWPSASGDAQRTAQAKSTFGILTSLSEGQPLGILESLASGRPCIVTTGCRMPMIPEQRLGWQADQVETLALAIRAACAISGPDYQAMSARCRTYVKSHHDWQRNSGRLGELYQQLMERETTASS